MILLDNFGININALVASLGIGDIAYEKDIAIIQQIFGLMQGIIHENEPKVRFDRAHFKGYGDSALLFEVVYYVLSPEYNQYMDIQQKINLALLRLLKDQGVEFAYPTRTLHIVPPINIARATENELPAGKMFSRRSAS